MLTQKLVPIVFVALPALAALTAQTTVVEATGDEATADACRTQPGSVAQPGAHWYYRINRINKQHCWYLGSQGAAVRSHGRGTVAYVHRHFARRNASVVRKHLAESDLKLELRTASAQIVPAVAAMPQASDLLKQATPADFATRWPDLPDSQDLPTGQVANHPTNDADQPMRLTVPVVDAERAGQQQASAGNAALGPVFLGGTLALLLAGGVVVVNRSRRTDLHDHWRTTASRPSQYRHMFACFADAAGNRLAGARQQPFTWRAPSPTDLADEFKTNQRELTRALRRAGMARMTPRSFAPPVRTRGNGGGFPKQAIA
jgi:hypothetical protein